LHFGLFSLLRPSDSSIILTWTQSRWASLGRSIWKRAALAAPSIFSEVSSSSRANSGSHLSRSENLTYSCSYQNLRAPAAHPSTGIRISSHLAIGSESLSTLRRQMISKTCSERVSSCTVTEDQSTIYEPCIPSASAFIFLALWRASAASIFLLLPRCTLRVLPPSRQEAIQ